jgi:hypothetical protein
MASIEGPTPGNFAELEHRMAELERLDSKKLASFRLEFHLAPPEPYAGIFKQLEPTPESFQAAGELLSNDSSLVPEAKQAMSRELWDRWKSIVKGQSGEGFND